MQGSTNPPISSFTMSENSMLKNAKNLSVYLLILTPCLYFFTSHRCQTLKVNSKSSPVYAYCDMMAESQNTEREIDIHC
jgi:hypothetical protein